MNFNRQPFYKELRLLSITITQSCMKIKLLLLLSLLLCSNSFSQIKGITKDANNTPLAFVNIYIEGTYTGTTSNNDGHYELNIAALTV